MSLIFDGEHGIPIDVRSFESLPARNNPNEVDDGKNANKYDRCIVHRANEHRDIWWHADQDT